MSMGSQQQSRRIHGGLFKLDKATQSTGIEVAIQRYSQQRANRQASKATEQNVE